MRQHQILDKLQGQVSLGLKLVRQLFSLASIDRTPSASYPSCDGIAELGCIIRKADCSQYTGNGYPGEDQNV
jgi:hypothetical protein